MSISRGVNTLCQNLRARLEEEFPAEGEWIDAALGNNLIQSNLEFRTRVARLVGLIKFFNDLPIFVPAVEQKILESIKIVSSVKNLNPAMTTSFFKVVMEHSKAVQAQLRDMLIDRRNDIKQILDTSVASLKQERPQDEKKLGSLDLKKAENSLQTCRELLQNATSNVLEEMVVVSQQVEPSRRISMLRAGLFGTKTFSGAIQLWSHNIDPITGPAPNAVRANTVPR